MPVLAKETALYPENLLLTPETVVDSCLGTATDRTWWVIYTKARQEKALARQLCAYRIPFYLPLVLTEHLERGRRMRTYLPLFSGYVFLFASPDERVGALTTNRVSQMLPVPQQDELLTDLRQVAALLAAGVPLTVEHRLAPGQKVRIRRGPFEGLEGTIIRRRGADRLLIAVSYLQQGVSVEINNFMVEAA